MDDFSRSQMIGIGVAFLILPLGAVGARIWAKTLSRKGITLDDYLILGALVSHLASMNMLSSADCR